MHRPTLDRRQLVLAGVALGSTALAAPALGASAQEPFAAVLAAFADEILRLSPEQASQLGVDSGRYYALKSTLSDLSPLGDAAWSAQVGSMRRRLTAMSRDALSPADQIRYDTVLYASERGIEGTRFFYGGGASAGLSGGAQPYVISQQNGVVTSVPEFLDSIHQVHTAADAEAYLSRVSAMARQLDQETRRIRSDAAQGVMPPDFIAAHHARPAPELPRHSGRAAAAGDLSGRPTRLRLGSKAIGPPAPPASWRRRSTPLSTVKLRSSLPPPPARPT